MPVRMRPIKPKGKAYDVRRLTLAMQRTLAQVADGIQEDFEKTTATWKHKPEFTKVRIPEGFEVSTSDEIYGYVDEGTRPHVIAPKAGKVLRFGVGGSPKTRVRVLGSGAGSRGSTIVHTRKPVQHPGTQAREFSDVIQEKWQKTFPDKLQQAIDEVLAAGGG